MKTLFTIAFLAFIGIAQAQTYVVPFKKIGEEKWGYITTDGTIVVPAKYHGTFNFDDGWGPAFDDVNDKWYFLNAEGEKLKVMMPGWEPKSFMGFSRKGFHNGLAIVMKDKKMGVINTSGEKVHSNLYKKINPFTKDGHATAIGADGHCYILHKDGTKDKLSDDITAINDMREGLAPVRSKKKLFGFVNEKGEVVIDMKFEAVGYFADGLAWVYEKKGMEKGYIDKTGNYALEPKYSDAKEFDPVSGMARVKIGDDWLYIDKSGKELRVEGERFVDFMDGLAEVMVNDISGLIDKEGNWVIKPKYRKIKAFKNGYAAVQTPDGKWGFVSSKGEEVIPPKYDGVRDVYYGFAAVSEERGKWGLIDMSGNWVLSPEYSNLRDAGPAQ